MFTMSHIVRPVALVLATAILSMSLYIPAVQASMVTTDQVMGVAETTAARTLLETTIMRVDVQQALLAQGVNPQDIQARVAALSDSEAAQMASQLDELPAGGDGLGLIVMVFLILVVMDIVCLTNIFPFTVKHCR